MIRNIDIWFKSYWQRRLQSFVYGWRRYFESAHILFTICDHYEPYWNKVSDKQAYKRVHQWLGNYPKIAAKHRDTIGMPPKHCFFYPIEEYKPDLLDMVGDICRAGYGETEIHLHHDNDTEDNLRTTLLDYINLLSGKHELLPYDKDTGEIKYGFIHGNWALDNSRPDGRWCGVNNEIGILQQTGCYADFTMPSAPDITQTTTVNSIYYALDNPEKPKSHDKGPLAVAGKDPPDGLLCMQGPLAFNVTSRKFGIVPRIENGCLSADMPVTLPRIKIWLQQQVHVVGRPDIIFVKLHTHGTQEKIMDYFFDQGGLDSLYSQLESYCDSAGHRLYYVSARQMFNVVKGLEDSPVASPADILENKLILSY